jgi:hypothetical protein
MPAILRKQKEKICQTCLEKKCGKHTHQLQRGGLQVYYNGGHPKWGRQFFFFKFLPPRKSFRELLFRFHIKVFSEKHIKKPVFI